MKKVISAIILAGFILPSCQHRTIPEQSLPLPELKAEKPPVTPLNRDAKIVTDIPYSNDNDPRHKLDIYLPPGKDFPTVVFVHGGKWSSGDKNMYAHLGRYFSNLGIGVVIPNYRLYPQVRIDDQTADVAKAVAWTMTNIASHGGSAQKVFISGHSSGAHVSALIVTDPSWLTHEGISVNSLRGAILVSGIYDIGINVKLVGSGDVFKDVNKKTYSPIYHVRNGMPSTLIVYADKDYRTLPGQAKDFSKAISRAGSVCQLLQVKGEDHIGIIIDVVKPEAQHGAWIANWVKTH